VSGPRAVVLGIAQDAGHPHVACTRACCAPAWTGAGHRVACVGLIDGPRRYLLDATPDLPRQLHALSPEGRLDGVFLTHAHIGHYTGLMYLGREGAALSAVPVWAMPRMADFLTRHAPWEALVRDRHAALEPLADGAPVTLGALTVTPRIVPHRDEYSETVGLIIAGPRARLAYVPDVDAWAEGALEALLDEVDLALVDGTFFDHGEAPRPAGDPVRHPPVRQTLERVASLPASARARLRFIHLNHTNPLLDPSSAASRAVRAAGCRVARQGDELPL
jgi:pyrroloquinoline quinone biosynthesis protein B